MTFRHWAVAGLVLAMAGCGDFVPTNDDIVREVKKCEAANMKAEFKRFGGDPNGRTMAIECVTEEQYAFDHKGK